MSQLGTVSNIQSVAMEVAQGIVKDELSIADSMLNLCKLYTILRDKSILCNLHKSYIPSLPDTCDICSMLSQT